MKNVYRYPGVKPFERGDRLIFFGRDRDREDLSGLILLEKLVVLFGKSGYGKSSLLNAAVVPDLESKRGFNSLQVRFGSYTEGQSLSAKQLLINKLEEKSKPERAMKFLDALSRDKTLWYHFKRSQSTPGKPWLLIFDQFEEYFLQPAALRRQFEEELAELLYTDVPQPVLDASLDTPDEDMARLTTPQDIRVVFSIRADRLSELDSMKTRLPAILHKRYELKGLSQEQAEAAIVEPASLPRKIDKENQFASAPFTWTPEAKTLLLHKLSEGQHGAGEGFIEAFQLQILCQYVESRIIASGDTKVDAADLPDIAQVYEAYYRQKIDQLPAAEHAAAHRMIEEELVYENSQTGEARRISLDKDLLLQKSTAYGASERLLRDLENTFLLRREPNTFGGYNYEISHDTLLAPILEAKNERRQEEIKKAEAEERRLKELEVDELRRQAEAEKQKRRRANLLSAAAVVGFLVATGLGVVARQQSNLAREAQQVAETKRQEAETTLQKFLEEKKQREKLATDELLRVVDKAVELGKYDVALRRLQEAQAGGNNDPRIGQRISALGGR